MSEEALSFTFQLRGPALEVHKGGEVELVSEIEFTAPTSRNMKEASQLKQALQRALNEAAKTAMEMQALTGDAIQQPTEEERKAAESNITGEDIMQALVSSTVPLEDVLEVGQKLLVSGVGKVLGDIKFNHTMAQTLQLDELERMVGEYALNFPLKSLLS